MKLRRAHQDHYYFEISQEEQIFLYHLLQQYPLVPAEYHTLSRHGELKNQEENERLLGDALKAQRRAHRQQITELLSSPGRFSQTADDGPVSVSFHRPEIEWLLQVCNDIRIGSWLALGSPDLDEKLQLRKEPGAARYIINMEIAGAFQMQFIAALNGEMGPHDDTAQPPQ